MLFLIKKLCEIKKLTFWNLLWIEPTNSLNRTFKTFCLSHRPLGFLNFYLKVAESGIYFSISHITALLSMLRSRIGASCHLLATVFPFYLQNLTRLVNGSNSKFLTTKFQYQNSLENPTNPSNLHSSSNYAFQTHIFCLFYYLSSPYPLTRPPTVQFQYHRGIDQGTC